ncbi:ATP-binding cassette domain-containing protein [Leptolyngbya sp. DQ-M1]|uniref:ABC transporter ATP-binding protein n=1 Tax=Leptolyngbya sp. DQ-M1 TaxID=2933920 RepID=UPI003299B3B1
MSAVEFCQVSYQLNQKRLISDLSFTIFPGETIVLLGRSGCGKTTTLRLINHLLVPTAGEVRVNGRSTLDWNSIQLRRQIGYVIQEVGLFPHFTVVQNIAVVPSLQKWEPDRIQSRVIELLELVGLEPQRFKHRYPHQLSGGQRQRVGVARALAADPPILLMDEPFGALDPITRVELQREFARLQQQLGKTIVFVTHDIQEAFKLGTRIGLMQAGQLVELGTPQEFARSTHPEAQAFMSVTEWNS